MPAQKPDTPKPVTPAPSRPAFTLEGKTENPYLRAAKKHPALKAQAVERRSARAAADTGRGRLG